MGMKILLSSILVICQTKFALWTITWCQNVFGGNFSSCSCYETSYLKIYAMISLTKKRNRKKPIFNQYSKPWKKKDLTEKNRGKEKKTWYMLLMRFNQFLVRFNQFLVRFKQENFSVWQNYWQNNKSCDKPRLSILKHWKNNAKQRLTKNS